MKTNRITTLHLNNIVWKEEKHYVAQCLNVDISSFGKTRKEALENLQEALELYFEDDDNHATVLEIEKPELITSSLRYA